MVLSTLPLVRVFTARKSFGAVQAVQRASATFRAGEIPSVTEWVGTPYRRPAPEREGGPARSLAYLPMDTPSGIG